MDDIQRALEAQLQLRSLFQSQAGGSKDLVALRRVRDLCALAVGATSDSHCRVKFAELENYADALFSDRKHQRWAARNQSSVLSLRHRAYAALDAVERRFDYIMTARKLAVRRTLLEHAVEEAGP